jgi:hypothetical protein
VRIKKSLAAFRYFSRRNIPDTPPDMRDATARCMKAYSSSKPSMRVAHYAEWQTLDYLLD